MLEAALPILILMSVAAVLGFSIAWVKRRIEVEDVINELHLVRNNQEVIEFKKQELVKHANTLHEEKRLLLEKNHSIKSKQAALLATVNTLETEINDLRTTQRSKGSQHDLLEETNASYLTTIESLQHTVHQYEQQFQEQEQMLDAQKAQIEELQDIQTHLKLKIEEQQLKWEQKYKSLNFKLLQVVRERDDLSKAQTPQETKTDDTSLTSSKTLDKIKKKFRKWRDNIDAPPELVKQTLPPEYLDKMGQSKPLADTANGLPKTPDNLQAISGIGPFIEQKLNTLGISRYEQIAQLDNQDILLVNKILELDPAYINEHEWIAQAKKLK